MFTTISSTTDGNPSALQVRKLTNGGYVVSRTGSQAYQQDAVFACKDIDDALGFIKDQFEPEKAEGDGPYSSARSLVAKQQVANAARAKEFSEAELQILRDASKEMSDALGLVFDADKTEAGIKSLRDNA